MKKLNKLAVVVFVVAVMLLNVQFIFADEWTGHTVLYDDKTYSDDNAYYDNVTGYGNGGAFYIGKAGVILKFTGNNIHFRSNEVTNRAGAIYNYESTVEIANGAEFSQNQAFAGGAIFNDNNSIFEIANGAKFSQNTSNNGGAIYNNNTSTFTIVDGAEFSKNQATTYYGGAITNIGTFTIGKNVKFTENKNLGTSDYGQGGAIYNTEIFNIGSNAEFKKNESKNGGAIYNSEGTVTIENGAKFSDNSSEDGAGIYNAGGEITIGSNVLFEGNNGPGNGEAIYNTGTITIGSDAVFEQNRGGNGGAIYNTGTIIIENGLTFTDNDAGNDGAILNGGTLTIKDGAKFTDNNSSHDGGTMFNGGTITIGKDVTFTNSSAGNDGGAIYNGGGNITIGSKALFEGNQSGTTGGAIYNSKTLTIADGATFKGNTSDALGGAIANFKETNIGNNAKFIENSSSDSIGGAIYNSGTFNIGDNAEFTKNTSYDFGGAICNFDDSGTITIGNNVKFIGNRSLGDIGNGNGGAIYNDGTINIGSNAIFADNFSQKSHGGAIYNGGSIIIGSNAVFTNNSSKEYFAGAIFNNGGIITIQNGATFKGNTAKQEGGAINNYGTINLIANKNNIEFTGNKHYVGTENEESNAIYAYSDSVINLYAEGANIIFNDKIKSYDNTTTLNINKKIEGYQENNGTGKIILNEDMSEYTGAVNLYGGTVKLGKKGVFFDSNLTVQNVSTIDMGNDLCSMMSFKELTLNNNLNLVVDADLANADIDTIAPSGFDGTGKIKITKINLLSNAKGEIAIEFYDDLGTLKSSIETVDSAVSSFYKYNVAYNSSTGEIIFTNIGINMASAAGAVASSVGGYATQSVVINQAFAGIDRQMAVRNQPKISAPKTSIKQTETKPVTKETVKPSQKSSVTPKDKKQPVKTNGKQNKKSANINSSNLYVSAGNQIFDDSTTIERSLWLRPFALQETIKLNGVDIDNTLYGTLAGIDLPVGQDKQLSFYIGYAGSKQEFDEVKTNQTGYLVGVTGMLIKEKWYLGVTVNGIFNKVSADSEDKTNDFDMNMFTIGAKAGYNIDLSDKWILEPNITVMYGIANSDSYETTLGSIDSQSTSNILVEPQVKAKWQLTNGWQPYGLVGYSANLSSKPKVKAGGEELELDSIDGFVEYGIGVNKEFIGTVWSCYGQVTGRSGGRNGFGGNLGIKYKF